MTTFPNSSKFIKTTLQHSTCTCHIFSSFHNVWKLENVVKQNGLSCLRYNHIQSLHGLYSCRTWKLCPWLQLYMYMYTIIIILGDWNWALKPTPLKLDKYFFPCPPIFLFYEVFILLFCPWISFLLIPVISNLWNTQPVIFRHFTQFTLARNTTKS